MHGDWEPFSYEAYPVRYPQNKPVFTVCGCDTAYKVSVLSWPSSDNNGVKVFLLLRSFDPIRYQPCNGLVRDGRGVRDPREIKGCEQI